MRGQARAGDSRIGHWIAFGAIKGALPAIDEKGGRKSVPLAR